MREPDVTEIHLRLLAEQAQEKLEQNLAERHVGKVVRKLATSKHVDGPEAEKRKR